MTALNVQHVGVKDVVFGVRVKIVEPCNLYGCDIGDDCFIGPLPKFRKLRALGQGRGSSLMRSFVRWSRSARIALSVTA